MLKRFLFIAAIALAVIGCEKSETTTTATPPTTTGGSGTFGSALKIVFIPKNSGNPYFNDVNKGFEKEAGEIKAEFTSNAPANGDATSQISVIKEQTQRGVDAITISANSPDALNKALDEATAKGITVITVDADLDKNESHRAVGVLPADFSQIGASQLELMGSLMGYEGDFAILSATTDAPNQNNWIATIKEKLKDPKYVKMKLVDVVYGDDKPEKSTTEAQALLSKYPNLRGILSPTSVGLAAAAQTLQIAGAYPGGPQAKGKGVELTGLSTPNQLKKFVEKGVVKSFQLWSPSDMGVLATYIVQQIRQKGLKPAEGVEIDVPGLGKRKFGKNNTIAAGELVTFDKSNIAKYDY